MTLNRSKKMTRSAGLSLVLLLVAACALALFLMVGWMLLENRGGETSEPVSASMSEGFSEAIGGRAAVPVKTDPVSVTEFNRGRIDGPSGDERAVSSPGRERAAGGRHPRFASISGRVTIGGTSDPAVGMRMIALGSHGGNGGVSRSRNREESSAIVAEDGTYRIAGLPAGEVRVFPTTGESNCVDLDAKHWKTLVLADGEEVAETDFVVSLGGVIVGRVVDRLGDPVDGASVGPNPLSGVSTDHSVLSPARREDKTDESGRFEIRGMPFGEKTVLGVRSPDHAPFWTGPLVVEKGHPELEIAVTLDRGSSIIGVVRTTVGGPAAFVKVFATPKRDGEPDPGEGLALWRQKIEQGSTDETGEFRLERVPAGSYELRCGERSHLVDLFGKSAGGVSVEVDGVNDVTGVLLSVAGEVEVPGGGLISGYVVDHIGNRVAGVEVEARQAGFGHRRAQAVATTNDEGAFTLAKLASGAHHLTASKAGFDKAESGDVEANGGVVQITLNRFATISGTVITRDGTSPESFHVRAQKIGEGASDEGREEMMGLATTDLSDSWTPGRSDGTFVLHDVPAGQVEVWAQAPGFAPNSCEELTILPGQELRDVVVHVLSGATLRGVVQLSSGEPVPGARVELRSAEAGEKPNRMSPEFLSGADKSPSTVSNEAGEFQFLNMAPGRYSVSASHPRYARSTDVPLSVQRSDVTVPDLVLSAGATIEGVVIRNDVPQRGFMVQCVGEAPMQMVTGEDGTFRFERLVAGEYFLSFVDTVAMRAGRAATTKTRQVKIDGENVEHVRVELGHGWRVYGTVEGMEEGEMTMVTVRRPGGLGPEDYDPMDPAAAMEAARFHVSMAFVGPTGTYEILDLEAGEYILEVPVSPKDPRDVKAYSKMDRTPRFRKTISVRNEDIELGLRLDVK